MKTLTCIISVVSALLFMGCETGPNSGRGFSLPEGDIDRGREVFVSLECNACHSVGDIEQLPSEEDDRISVMLGGRVGSVRTYGDLVTSVINPSHKLARRYPEADVTDESGLSRMRVYNDVMTVSQLVDVVTFLQSNYTLVKYERTRYRIYHP